MNMCGLKCVCSCGVSRRSDEQTSGHTAHNSTALLSFLQTGEHSSRFQPLPWKYFVISWDLLDTSCELLWGGNVQKERKKKKKGDEKLVRTTGGSSKRYILGKEITRFRSVFDSHLPCAPLSLRLLLFLLFIVTVGRVLSCVWRWRLDLEVFKLLSFSPLPPTYFSSMDCHGI